MILAGDVNQKPGNDVHSLLADAPDEIFVNPATNDFHLKEQEKPEGKERALIMAAFYASNEAFSVCE